MLTEADTLLTIAEIGVAFAGFTALAATVGRRRSKESAQVDLERLRAVILISLLVVITAVIPIVVARYQLAEDAVWRISSLVTLLLNWACVVVVSRHARRGGLISADRLGKWSVYALEVGAELPIIANVLGLCAAYAPAFYLTFLVISLCQTGFLFIGLVDSLFAHDAAG